MFQYITNKDSIPNTYESVKEVTRKRKVHKMLICKNLSFFVVIHTL